jgi:hypothetical protein
VAVADPLEDPLVEGIEELDGDPLEVPVEV